MRSNGDGAVQRRDGSNDLLLEPIEQRQMNAPMGAAESKASAQVIDRDPRHIGLPIIERRAEEPQRMAADSGDV